MKHIFQAWEAFSSDVGAAAHLLLLSDYDGTLTPIVGRPDEAVLSPESRERLIALVLKPAFSVGIISGRSIAEVKALVGIEGIYYAGNHGLEIEGPSFQFVHPLAKAAQPKIRELLRELSAGLAAIKGVIVEDKGLSLSVHYRLVREDEVEMVARIFHRATSPWLSSGEFRITSGKKVWEVRPPIDWHKGRAVETIIEKIKVIHGERCLTIYLGDDTTDEDAFKVLHRPQGWSIFVGQGNTLSNADYFLDSTSEVMVFLSRLHDLK